MILYSCRISAAYYIQDISDSVLNINNHLTKDEPPKPPFNLIIPDYS